MFGKTTELKALEARKQLLLVESELNRAQLLNDLRDIKNEIHRLKVQAHAISSVAASAAKLSATFSSIGNAFSHRGEDKNKSWVSMLFRGMKTGASLWLTLKSYLR